MTNSSRIITRWRGTSLGTTTQSEVGSECARNHIPFKTVPRSTSRGANWLEDNRRLSGLNFNTCGCKDKDMEYMKVFLLLVSECCDSALQIECLETRCNCLVK